MDNFPVSKQIKRDISGHKYLICTSAAMEIKTSGSSTLQHPPIFQQARCSRHTTGAMLGQRLQRWPNIAPAVAQCLSASLPDQVI